MNTPETDTAMRRQVERIHQSGVAAAFVVAGGGSSAIPWLLDAPGASRTVLEAQVPYHPEALARYLLAAPAQAVSAETAERLAARAYARAGRLRTGPARYVGMACTAALATDRERLGAEQAFVAVRSSGACVLQHLQFAKGEAGRSEQEYALGILMLNALGEACGLTSGLLPPPAKGVASIHATRTFTATPFDDLEAGRWDVLVVEPDGRVHADPGEVRVLLSGSFDPLHRGHLELAATVQGRLGRPVDLELSMINPDKAPLSPHEALVRIGRAAAWRHRVLVTRAATFVEKARLFPGCCFVVGHDTAERVVRERYYGGCGPMGEALRELRTLGNRFLVAGRVEDEVFLGLRDLAIPSGFADLFEAIPEPGFRVDISSTDIRERMRSCGEGL